MHNRKGYIYQSLLLNEKMEYSGDVLPDSLVDKIIKEPKFVSIKDLEKDFIISKRGEHREKSIALGCETYECSMKIRQTIDKPDNFSVILVFKDSNRNYRPILRLNGNHGTHCNRLERELIRGPHIHKITEKYQEMTNHPDGYAVATDRYTNLHEAIAVFLELVNIRIIETKDNR